MPKGLEDARIAAEARANAESEADKLLAEAQTKAGQVIREASDRADQVAKDIRAQVETEAARPNPPQWLKRLKNATEC